MHLSDLKGLYLIYNNMVQMSVVLLWGILHRAEFENFLLLFVDFIPFVLVSQEDKNIKKFISITKSYIVYTIQALQSKQYTQ